MRTAPDRVVVTGAQGLLGRHVTDALLSAGIRAVLGLGRSPRRDDAYTHTVTRDGRQVAAPVPQELAAAATDDRYRYAQADLADASAVAARLEDFGPDTVVHTVAALRDSPWSELRASNIDATLGLTTAAARVGVRRLVLTSSGSVYGAGRGVLPLHEDGPTEPVDLYGVSKRCAEDVARVVAAPHGLSVVSARVFNLVGPGLQERHLPALLARELARARREPGPHRLALGPLGSTRDFVDVRDAAAALVVLASLEDVPAVVNVASGVETPVRHVLEVLREITGQPAIEIEEATPRTADVSRSVADVARLAACGFVATRSLEDSLARMVTYYDDLGRAAGAR